MVTPEELGLAFAGAPDPELARVAVSRVGEDPVARDALAEPGVLHTATRLLGFSTAAADFLVAFPEETVALRDVAGRTSLQLASEAREDVVSRGASDGLRRFRRRAMMRIAARDLTGGASLESVTGEISAVAEACLELALAEVSDDGEPAVIALGKLGGRELNYSSDVDLVFVHSGEAVSGAEAEQRVAALIHLLSEPTAAGVALRVDPALRPGGRSGALSRSLAGTLSYYETEAATWERQAMLKARPVAGDAELGQAFLDGVRPLIYPDELAASAIDEVRQTKVRLEEFIRARGKERTEVKRGRGGIRDVEFAVQLLQLVHGRRDHRLRESGTLPALEALEEGGYVAGSDAQALGDAYRFLRTLEHRLQIVRDLQTHELPADVDALRPLARSLGLDGPKDLSDEYARQTDLVRGLHERLFYRPLLEAFAGSAGPRPGVDRDATEELLAGLGFARPPAAYDIFRVLVDPATRMGKVLANLFPVVAPALALSPDPDTALVRFERIVERLRSDEAADALATDPTVARRLASVAGVSSFATDLLIAEPARLAALSGGASDAAGDLVGVAARYAAREIDAPATGSALADLADEMVGGALVGAGPTVAFSVIALGKFGARELTFASDLDLLFVYEGEGASDLAEAARVAEVVLADVRAAGWQPDADLRPEGRSGPLARSIAGYLEYWQRWAETWEFQTLLRARFVAGDEVLGLRFVSNAADVAYPEILPVEQAAEILRMRARMENERVKPADAGRFHFKLGVGGLADVQFAVELCLRRFGGNDASVRKRGSLEAIEALAAAGALEESTALALGEAFVFLSNVKDALEVDRRVAAETLPASPDEQAALARRLGYEEYPRQSFLEDYLRITHRSRRAMERVFAQAGVAEPDADGLLS